MNIQKINQSSYAYPDRLRELKSPPNLLYAVGNLKLLEEIESNEHPWIAVVGTRNPSFYGNEISYQIAGELAKAGVIIVSGLALGTDARAHQAAVDQGKPTVAVVARGLDEIYPKENHELAKQIIANKGLIISEYANGVGAFKQHFVARNRIISGLSRALLIIEADERSGTKHTARFANEAGVPVMATPGNITSSRSSTTNNLIRDGATLITSASDVLLEFGYLVGTTAEPIKAESREEGILIDLLKEGVNHSEELIARSGLSAQEFANLISLMEIGGKVLNLGAGQWVLRR